jgi:hypothetical protein
MWIEVTSILGEPPQQWAYRGELLSVPLLLDPAKVRVGSPVNFTADQIYPIERKSKRRVRR